MSRYWSDIVHALTPYTPGEQPQIDNLVKLNTNENPYPPSPRVLAAIRAASDDDLRKYPDPAATRLKQVIADYHHLEPGQVFVGNSSDEVLAHTFKALLQHQQPLLFPDITYSFYPVYCELFQIDYQLVPLDAEFHIDTTLFNRPNGGIIFANPNAPTGLALDLSAIESLLQANRESVVVVDEAYADFSAHSAVGLINHYDNLLIVQTLSKSRSLAGLRVGLALGHSKLIEALERVKNSFHPYALSRLAIAGAVAAYEDREYFEQTRAQIIATRAAAKQQLEQMGFDVLDSQANFVFASHPKFAAETLFTGLRQQGVVVRYFDKPRLREYLRISIGSDEEMMRFFSALETLISD